MLLNPTAEEERELKELYDKHSKKAKNLKEKYLQESDLKKAEKYRDEYLQAVMTLSNVMEAKEYELQAEHFAQIRDDKEAIFKDAQEQIDAFIPWAHREVLTSMTEEDLNATKWGTVKDGKKYLSALHTANSLREELRLHFEAFKGDKHATRKLIQLISTGIKNSPLTENIELTRADIVPSPVKDRRAALPKIEKYKMAGDELNKALLTPGYGNNLFEQELDGQIKLYWDVEHKLSGNSKKKGKLPPQTVTYVSMAFDTEDLEKSVRKMRRLRAYDRAVIDAIGSIGLYWEAEHPYETLKVTPEEIWKVMNGKQGDYKTKPSPAALKKINQSIEKMSLIRLHMDITEELEYYDFSDLGDELQKGVFNGYLLPTESVQIEFTNGKISYGYEVLKAPFIYRYNKAKNRLVSVEAHLLDTSQYISDTDYVTEFKHYLLMSIALMKRGDISNRILLETLYEKTGVGIPRDRVDADTHRINPETGEPFRTFKSKEVFEKAVRKAKQDDLKKIEGILSAWKDKEWIKGFTPIDRNKKPAKAGQIVIGYDIQL